MRCRDYELKQKSVFIKKEDADSITAFELPEFLKSIGFPEGVDFKVQFVKDGMRIGVIK